MKKIIFFCPVLLCATLAFSQAAPKFQDVTSAAGIHFVHDNGAAGKKYLPETLGSGVGFIDYDNDGYQDVVLLNGHSLTAPAMSGRGATGVRLYHNNRNGTFTDVTARSGLAVAGYAMGVAVGDFDNDGYDDLFITTVGQSHLFHNNHNGTFTDVTRQAGMDGIQELSTSAAWIDYDRDGKLDLIVGNYVQWSVKADLFCTLDGTHKSYCTPESYKGNSVRLWHNEGNGKFKDVTEKMGLKDMSSKTLGIAVLDYDGDGWPDLLFANDTQPNKLYANKNGQRFTEVGVAAGIAYSDEGIARAGMGVDSADYDRSGRPSILITNFANQMLSLYHNEGNGLFIDEAPRSEVGRSTLLTLGFGCFFFDYDLDGWPDIFVADGHIEDQIERIQKRVTYAEPPHLFHNLGHGKFADVTSQAGPAFNKPRVARGAAYADIDEDGRPDMLIMTNGGPAVLLRNETAAGQSLRIKLIGTRSNRDGIGAAVTVTSATGKQSQMLRSGSSYLSQSELILTFGLGSAHQADAIDIAWPSGTHETIKNIAAGERITITEGKGVTAKKALDPRR